MFPLIPHWVLKCVASFIALCILLGTLMGLPAAALAQPGPAPATLVAIRAATHEAKPHYDRVIFRLQGNLPESIRTEYVSTLIADGSGAVIPIAGKAIVRLTLTPAVAHTDAGHPTVPRRVSYDLPIVQEIVRSGDFEAVVSYGIGLSHKTAFRSFNLTNPNRVVIDFFYP